MIRRTFTALLAALLASFALSSPADAAVKKTARPRAKQAEQASTGTTQKKATVKKKKATTRKKKASANGSAKKKSTKPSTKRKPSTKPH